MSWIDIFVWSEFQLVLFLYYVASYVASTQFETYKSHFEAFHENLEITHIS